MTALAGVKHSQLITPLAGANHVTGGLQGKSVARLAESDHPSSPGQGQALVESEPKKKESWSRKGTI